MNLSPFISIPFQWGAGELHTSKREARRKESRQQNGQLPPDFLQDSDSDFDDDLDKELHNLPGSAPALSTASSGFGSEDTLAAPSQPQPTTNISQQHLHGSSAQLKRVHGSTASELEISFCVILDLGKTNWLVAVGISKAFPLKQQELG